ncbi:conserved hypothetical protein [Vibrio coralliirubri]|uniref:hypothetical protein n=1 Tax=Vibrio coralliirubri TaxID=1516159 RepID=UPI0006323A24|nr:hypothetical protein [Vibrio coralliirubri]CDT88414.1 conserved hypothetical protein [Vibrio coralliirubri]
MKKSEAMQRARSIYGIDFQNRNTHFSKINKALPVWWLEVSLDKIDDNRVKQIYFLLEDGVNLHLLDIPTDYLRQHKSGFYIQHDKNHMCFKIDISSYQELMGSKRELMKRFKV